MYKNDNVLKKDDNIVTRQIADETILVPIREKIGDMQKIFSISETANYIWKNIDGKKTVRDIYNELLENYDVPDELLRVHLMEFIDALYKAHLVSIVE